MKKSLCLLLLGAALALTFALGWNGLQSKAEAQGPAIIEIWAAYGTPDWDGFEEAMNYASNKGYRLGGYAVTRNSKGSLVKFAVMERR